MRKTIGKSLAALAFLSMPALAAAQDAPAAETAAPEAAAPDIEMWRLDCGTIELSDAGPFSDGHLYDGQAMTLTDSCYVIRHGDRYLLWDTGLPAALIGNPSTQWVFTVSVTRSIVDQLAEIGIAPEQITYVGLSHYHDDHIGQAAVFSHATLLMNQRDIDAIRDFPVASAAAQLQPWLEGGAPVESFARDHDVFGDGSVTILAMPGHTPGHGALLVRLPETGNVLLTGDLYHFEAQIENNGVPSFNTDRADTLASFERFDQIHFALSATVVIQHDPDDIDLLPAFPASAR